MDKKTVQEEDLIEHIDERQEEETTQSLPWQEKLKAFATSNPGIFIIALLFLCLLASIKSCHSAHHEVKKTAHVDVSAWDNPPADRPIAPPPVPFATKEELTKLTNQVDALSKEMQALKAAFGTLNQKLQTESKPPVKKRVRKPSYQVLGTYLDQDTNVWVAQVLYGGQIHTVTAYEAVGPYQVRSVGPQGAVLR